MPRGIGYRTIMYRLDFDPERELIVVTAEGFWTVAMVERYVADLEDLARKLRPRHPALQLLIHAEDMAVQPQEVSEAFATTEKRLLDAVRPGRVAVLAGSVLTRMQARHAFQDPNARVFFDKKEALYWLSKPAAEASETPSKATGEKPSSPPAASPHPPGSNPS